ncbi:MAG: cupin domain-containing protein [Burkholderiales bacterium]|jgi:quercetin dioxygenase-like cupin family protein
MTLPTLEQYTEQTARLGYETVLVREWAPGFQTQAHEHPFDARGLVVAGEFWLTLDGNTRRLLPGDIFEVPRGTTHAERYGDQGCTFWAARRG